MKNKIIEHFKKIGIRRIVVMIIANIVLGFGVGISKYSLMGNDPCNAAYMAVAGFLNIPYSYMSWILNGVYFVIEIIFGRQYIGLGTFVNWFAVGVSATLCYNILDSLFVQPESFIVRLLILIVGVVVLSFSVSLYQKSDAGISPYDSVPIILSQKTHIPFFLCRIALDGFSSFVAWSLGGIVGLGTLVSAFGTGPLISIFDKTVSEKIVGKKKETV